MIKGYFTFDSFANEMRSNISGYSLVVVDIDETILRMPQYFCGGVWYNNHYNKTYALEIFDDCVNKSKVLPVSSEFNDFLSEMSYENLVVGLTARKFKYHNITVKSLESIKMNFTQKLDHPDIHKGIFFSGVTNGGVPENKGDFLLKILTHNIFQNVTDIVFIDDNKHNVESVLLAFTNDLLYNMTIIHYTEVHNHIYPGKNYDLEFLSRVGEFQEQHFLEFGVIIPDHEVVGNLSCNVSDFGEL